MTDGIQTFEAGVADGTTATTGNLATGLTPGFTMTPVVANGGTVQLRTTNPHRGTTAVQFDAATTGAVARIDLTTSGSQNCLEPYMRIGAYPSIEQPFLHFFSSSLAGYVTLGTTGLCKLYDDANVNLWTAATAIPLSAFVRYSLGQGKGTTSVSPFNGALRFQYFAGADLETSNPTETAGPTYFGGTTSTTANTGTLDWVTLRFGKLGSGAGWSGITFDDVQFRTAGYGLIGPVTGTLPVLSGVPTDQWVLDVSGASGSPTMTLTQLSGPTGTITGPTAGKFTFTRPAGMATAAVVQLTGSNGAGAGTPINFTIPATGGTVTNLVRDILMASGVGAGVS